MNSTIGLVGNKDSDYIKEFINNIIDDSYDIYIVDQESDLIKNEEICEYIDKFTNTSYLSNKQVFIFYDLDKVSFLNQNKLLKTIEDNKDNCIQIFTFSNKNSVLTTILSRLVVYNFNEKRSSEISKIEDLLKSEEIVYISENSKYETISNLYNLCLEKQYVDAYILYFQSYKEVTNMDVTIIQSILLYSLIKNNLIEIAYDLIGLDIWNINNINKKVYLDNLFVSVHKKLRFMGC